VEGSLPLANKHIVTNAAGESPEWREGSAFPRADTYALCRCGRSKTKPFCDGTHARVHFDGTETASREPYERQAKQIIGPTMVLEDAERLCAFARFCATSGILSAKRINPALEHWLCMRPAIALRDAWSRRIEQQEIMIEPHLEPSLGLVQDSAKGISGPLWVRGGVPVVAPMGKRTRCAIA
jgi:CDGSH-type Zn-finger protein